MVSRSHPWETTQNFILYFGHFISSGVASLAMWGSAGFAPSQGCIHLYGDTNEKWRKAISFRNITGCQWSIPALNAKGHHKRRMHSFVFSTGNYRLPQNIKVHFHGLSFNGRGVAREVGVKILTGLLCGDLVLVVIEVFPTKEKGELVVVSLLLLGHLLKLWTIPGHKVGQLVDDVGHLRVWKGSTTFYMTLELVSFCVVLHHLRSVFCMMSHTGNLKQFKTVMDCPKKLVEVANLDSFKSWLISHLKNFAKLSPPPPIPLVPIPHLLKHAYQQTTPHMQTHARTHTAHARTLKYLFPARSQTAISWRKVMRDCSMKHRTRNRWILSLDLKDETSWGVTD